MKTEELQTRLYLLAAIILLAGLGSAVSIYLTAGNASESILLYDSVNSKMYIHNLEVYGGKANVLADEVRRWFNGLWHGQSLAFTVACITIVTSFGLFFVAYNLPSDSKPDARG